MLIYSNFNLEVVWTEGGGCGNKVWERKEKLWPLPPPGTEALTTCKTLFNLNPLINISNHTSPSTEGEKENLPLSVGSLSHLWKERVCVWRGNRGRSQVILIKKGYSKVGAKEKRIKKYVMKSYKAKIYPTILYFIKQSTVLGCTYIVWLIKCQQLEAEVLLFLRFLE